jgi:hypothetical protein
MVLENEDPMSTKTVESDLSTCNLRFSLKESSVVGVRGSNKV